jgi:hypothetical protein
MAKERTTPDEIRDALDALERACREAVEFRSRINETLTRRPFRRRYERAFASPHANLTDHYPDETNA